MFKRVRSLIARKEDDGEAGIDEETRAEVGLDDESASELGSDSDQDSEDDEAEVAAGSADLRTSSKRKRMEGGEDASSADAEELESENESEPEDIAPMSVDQALQSQIYIPVIGPTKGGEPIKLCVVCPSKSLKNDLAIETHLESSSHARRLKRFTTYVEATLKEHERGSLEGGGADPRHVMAEADHKKEVEEQEAKKQKTKKPLNPKEREKLEALKTKRADKIARRRAVKEARKAARNDSEDSNAGAITKTKKARTTSSSEGGRRDVTLLIEEKTAITPDQSLSHKKAKGKRTGPGTPIAT